jgi:hypothetical protein
VVYIVYFQEEAPAIRKRKMKKGLEARSKWLEMERRRDRVELWRQYY